MIVIEEYQTLAPKMELLLSELDRLRLETVAVHVDLALRRLEDIISHELSTAGVANVQ